MPNQLRFRTLFANQHVRGSPTLWNLHHSTFTIYFHHSPKLKTANDVVRQMSKKSRFQKPFESQHVKALQTLKYACHHFYHTFHHSEKNWVQKCLCSWFLKSQDCLLAHWLPMKSIFFVIKRICRNHFQCNYLKNWKLFLSLSLNVLNLHSTLNILEKKMTLAAYGFPKLQAVKDVVRQMSKKPLFRTLFNSQHVKWSETLVKSAWHLFYDNLWSLCAKLTWKMSLLVICEILGLFVNTLNTDVKYFLRNSENLLQPIQKQLSKKQKHFRNILLHFWSLHQIVNIEREMTLITYIFPKLRTEKDLVTAIPKKRLYRTKLDSQHVKVSQTLVKSSWQHFYRLFSSISWQLTRKMFHLVVCQILGHFVNTFSADDKYSLRKSEIFRQPIQMQLPKKQITYCEFQLHLSNLHQFFNFFKKENSDSLFIFKITDCGKRV